MPPLIRGKTTLTWMHGEKTKVDRTGKATVTSPFGCPRSTLLGAVPTIGTPHRIYGGVYADEVEALFDEGALVYGTVTYCGLPGVGGTTDPPPVYSLLQGLSQEPIDSHKKFVSTIGGKPGDVGPHEGLHGAIFNDDGTFKGFKASISGVKNPKAGLTEYLLASKIWRKTWCSKTKPTSVANSGYIGTPEGSPPTLVSGANWLVGPYQIISRGGGQFFEMILDMLASGPNGWDTDIYTAV